ncbi:L,D-transpeptidase [Candidatus Kaiserbacteria bacterium]|nr:L,D-transpeptidase [Candidatus Kaiserbacteria bacterium]
MRGLQFSTSSAALVFAIALASLFWIALSVSAMESDVPIPVEIEEVAVPNTAHFPPAQDLHEYIEVMEGCNYAYAGECVRSYAGPGREYATVNRLRKGIVLKVGGSVLNDLRVWYRIIFDEPLRYPERVARAQYVAAEDVRHFYSNGVQTRGSQGSATHSTQLRVEASTSSASTKHILVDRSEQMLYAYEGETLFMQVSISTGIQLTPTPRGVFTIYKRTPTRYMQGPLPDISEKYYDLPGVPWNLYFTNEGGVIHGAYWHKSFGTRWSNGCVNLPLAEARTLYEWAEVGTKVLVRD